jgi:putative ABC transport system ATP-binding protein
LLRIALMSFAPRAAATQGAPLSSGAPPEALVQLVGVSKIFPGEDLETQALKDIHLHIGAGEWVAVVGPSGSGKTTLLSILGLLDTPSEGSYQLSGTAALSLPPHERARLRNQHVGLVFQNFNLIGDLTVYENVELPLTFRKMPFLERRRRVELALERVGMRHRSNHFPGQLSGGQQQRVSVARAVAGEPLLLLADEPTGNLDSKNGEAVMSLLGNLHKNGTTICMVTHNDEYARRASRTISLFDGRIVADNLSKAAHR